MNWLGRAAGMLAVAARVSVRQPGAVLLVALLLAGGSLGLAVTRLSLRTSNLDLIDTKLPPVQRFQDFAARFGTPNSLVVVLEGADQSRLRSAADRLEVALRQLPGVRSVFARLPLDPAVVEVTGVDPYLSSEDGGLLFLFVQPEDAYSRVETLEPFVAGVEERLQAELAATQVRAGTTGMPRFALDDRNLVQRDIGRLSALSLILVLVLFATAFGDIRRPLAATLALAFGVVVTVGFAAIYPGHLTLLSAFFASILLGLGIDSGIHIVARTEELLGEGLVLARAVPRAVGELAPSLAGSALTTASVLWAMQLSGFRGFAELGAIAGTGVVICLLSMVTVLPALLSLSWTGGRQLRPWAGGGRRLGRILVALQSRPLAWLLVLAALTGLLGGLPSFDTDYLNLQPVDSETVRLEREMVRRSSWSPELAAFTVGSRQELQDLVWRLSDDETVGTVRSMLDFEVLPGVRAELPPDLLRAFESTAGQLAVYAYPQADIWDPLEQQTFIDHMLAIDSQATGMPFLGQFMVERSKRALWVTAAAGAPLLLIWVFSVFRDPLWTLLAVMPTGLTVSALIGLMKLFGLSFNPLDIMALPVVLGIAVDDGIHLVHRYRSERGDLHSTLIGTGRSIVLTSLTTLAAFVTLALTSHRGLASFAQVLGLGVGAGLVLSLLVLPTLLQTFAAGRFGSQQAPSS